MPAPTTEFFTGRMPFLPPNQQRQSTEGIRTVLLIAAQILQAVIFADMLSTGLKWYNVK